MKVVTDSVADLPREVVASLGITVVPLFVHFGDEEYRDGIDLTTEQFYEKLRTSPHFPLTSAVSPQDFAAVYDRLADETEEILVITISARLSVTYQSALAARELAKGKCRIEVVDSRLATMAQGFVVMRAAQAALEGATLEEARQVALREIPRAGILCCFRTLEYLRRGGRIGAAAALLGSMLKVHPMLALEDGIVVPAGRTRSRAAAVERLCEYVASFRRLEELAVENTACPEEAEALVDRLSAWFPRERIYRSEMTPVIGTHTGPGLLLVATLGDRGPGGGSREGGSHG